MKRAWQRLAARIDEMSLRQRAMLFAAASLVLVALVNATLIEPLLGRQKTLIDRVNRDQSQLTAVRGQLQSVLNEGQADAKDPEQAALFELERRVADSERELAARRAALIAPTQLTGLLKTLLGKNPRVSLESLQVTPGVPASAPRTGQSDALPELYKHGAEMTLKGGYFDLVNYLAELERSPARLLWGAAELQVEQYPEVRLKVQVYTVSSQRTLLVP